MEALTISAANLDTIEKNLGAVANELSGVISNVSSVNNQINQVEEQVSTLNNEVQNLVKEIRETTIITNARQAIMYNNAQIEKKFGFHDKVRRTTESLIEALEKSKIDPNYLVNLQQDLILNNPNYWLVSAISCLTSWALDDKANSEKELHNALNKDQNKTSLFFCLVNLKLDRKQTALNWLNKYLNDQNPLKLNKDFISLLDLTASGIFGNEAKNLILSKINTWFSRLNSEPTVKDNQINFWTEFIISSEYTDITMPTLEGYSSDINILKNNLAITSSYQNVLTKLKKITYTESTNKSLNDIIKNLIYDYEEQEQIYQKDNLKNQLIISCNGRLEEAEKLYQKQVQIYDENNDLPTLLSNIVLYKDSYHISNETQQIALSLIKDYIIEAFSVINKKIDTKPFNITIGPFVTKTETGLNKEEISNEVNNYIESTFIPQDKDLIFILLLVNIIGIIGIFITLNNRLLCALLIAIVIISNIILFVKLNKRSKNLNNSKKQLKLSLNNTLERVLAETIDYNNMMQEDKQSYNELINFLNNINANNFIKNNQERNINIGE